MSMNVVCAHAASVVFVPPDHTPGLNEEFSVDVLLDTEGASVNGIDATLTFTQATLSLVRVEDGSSIVPLWIERPRVLNNTIAFSGIIPNGFNGLIDPFDIQEKKPGKIVRLVFRTTTAGNAAVSLRGTLTHNDGNGTQEYLPDTGTSFTISSTHSQNSYNIADTVAPVLIASRVRDAALYEGRFVLVFSTTDKDSGVAYVEVKEKKGKWKKIESPYLLEDQSDNATLQVRAVDFADNVTLITIGDSVPSMTVASYIFFALVLLVGFPLMVFYYKRYASQKK